MTVPFATGRRTLIKAMVGGVATLAGARLPAADEVLDSRAAAASAHFPFGPVIPALEFPSVPLRTHDGRTVDSRTMFRSHVTALQLMFTSCSATCPIQGAIFAAAQRHVGAELPSVRFVSLSIDPLADTPAALTAWLAEFRAGSGWSAAAPRRDDLQSITALLRGDAGLRSAMQPRPSDAHTAQVFYLDREARLVLRSADFPSALQIAETLRRLS